MFLFLIEHNTHGDEDTFYIGYTNYTCLRTEKKEPQVGIKL